MDERILHATLAQAGRPELLRQWDAARNAPLTPDTVGAGSGRKVWWRCEKGHEWQAAVRARVHGHTGCPFCAGKRTVSGENDLAAAFPGLVREWHPTKNLPLTPEQVTPGSNREIWWRCEKGHEWRARVADRTRAGSGCPVCAGRRSEPGVNDLTVTHPAVAAEWHPTKNRPLEPQQVTAGSGRVVWWRCENGHEWQASVCSRAGKGRHAGCPVCRRAKGEAQGEALPPGK